LTATPGGRLVQAVLDLDGQFHDLSKRYVELEADRVAKDQVIARLISELEAVQSDRAAKDQVIARLISELEAVRADQSAKEEVIVRLQAMLEAKEAVITQMSDELSEYKSLGWGLPYAIIGGKHKLARWRDQRQARPPESDLKAPDAPATTTRSRVLHVALDVMQIQFGISGGIEVYMKTLVRALMCQAKQAVCLTLLCTPDQVSHLQELFDDQVSYYSFHPESAVSALAALQNVLPAKARLPVTAYANVSFAPLGETLAVDILHSPVQVFSQTDFTVPGVLNLHDLQHLHHPENFTAGDLEARNRLYGQSAALASAIMASSDFVRQDIIERMGIPASKVYTIPVAFNPDVESGLQTFTPEQARHTYHLPQTFGFYPAQFWIHKNHARLVEALAIVRARAPQHNFKLVFTGYRGLSGWPLVEKALETHNMRDHVLLLDFVPTEHLGAIYRLATFCVVPSLFEASSYPVIEAQMLGCPAMCSRVTSLPELVAEGAGLLFDPLSPEDMADKMLRWLNDPADRVAHAERGRQRAQRYHSLAAYATNVLDLYTKVIDLHTTARRG
jgi:glycosyltransferase involved in cell wall biosynthesis